MATENNNGCGRREFLKLSALGALLTAPVATALSSSNAWAQAPKAGPPVSESDPQAKALGYVKNAAKFDMKKLEGRVPAGVKPHCWNCVLYVYADKANSSKSKTAPCQAMGNKTVEVGGLCNSWVNDATRK